MNYRRFGKLDWKVSALGFGAMRLPSGSEGGVDEAESIKMIRYAIDHGVNYVDTAYTYLKGQSEIVVGKALKDGYREKVRLATKISTRSTTTREELDKSFHEQLRKLQVDHVDTYLFGGMGEEQVNSWHKIKTLHFTYWAEEKIKEGKMGHIGFSFHGGFDAFKETVDCYDGWTFCQFIINYLDADHSVRSPGLRAAKYAAQKGLAVIAIEPIQGGNLATKSTIRPEESPIKPGEIQTLLNDAGVKRSPADLALQWVWNQPEVSLALSGMSSMKQVIENVESANHSPDKIAEADLKAISKICELDKSRPKPAQRP